MEQFDKAYYVEAVRRIRDEEALSLHEIAGEIGMSYMAIKRLLDPECKAPIRGLTVRKIRTLLNKYKVQHD